MKDGMSNNSHNYADTARLDWSRHNFRQGFLQVVLNPWCVLALLVTAVVVALLGPFGSYASVPMPERLVYWVLLIGLNSISAMVLFWLFIGLKSHYDRWYELALPIAFTSAVNGLPGAVVVKTVHAVFAEQASLSWSLADLIGLALNVVLLTGLFFTSFLAVRVLTQRVQGVEPNGMLNDDAGLSELNDNPELSEHNNTELSAFHARIPEPVYGDLLALSSEDHYLRVYTTAGNALIHCKLQTAISELSASSISANAPKSLGQQVHRSHWVAAGAVTKAERHKNQWQLTLRNGVCIPVSRQYAPALKSAGWFASTESVIHEK